MRIAEPHELRLNPPFPTPEVISAELVSGAAGPAHSQTVEYTVSVAVTLLLQGGRHGRSGDESAQESKK